MASLNEAYSGFVVKQNEIDEYKEGMKERLRQRDLKNFQACQNNKCTRDDPNIESQIFASIKSQQVRKLKCKICSSQIITENPNDRMICRMCSIKLHCGSCGGTRVPVMTNNDTIGFLCRKCQNVVK